jgi:hypothetical protein
MIPRRTLMSSATRASRVVPTQSITTPSEKISPAPEGFVGPWRVSGLRGSRADDTEEWISEIVPAIDGPFTWCEHPMAFEWWDGQEWIATD